jgi:hypothetical protein
VTPAGTDQLQLPTVVKVRIMSPLDAVVEVGTQLFALAGTGIETKRLASKSAEMIVAIFGHKNLSFMHTKLRITFTSLFSN